MLLEKTLASLMKTGGAYKNLACAVYVPAHLEKARFSAPASLIFCTPVIRAYSNPASLNASSSCCLDTLNCTMVVVTETITMLNMTSSPGRASSGAKDTICVIYTRENRPVRAADSMLSANTAHS